MILAGDIRKGTTFVMDGEVYQVIDFNMLSQVRVLPLLEPSLGMLCLELQRMLP